MKSKKYIFIVNGKPTCGKDTFCNFVAEHSDAVSISSIDKVVEAMKVLGWDGVKTDVARNMMSEIKDRSTLLNDGPFNYCLKTSTELPNRIVFVHVRELSEITKLKEAINELSDLGYVGLTLQVDRDVKVTAKNTGDNDTLKPYPYDIVIDNNKSLESLEFHAMKFADYYMSKNDGRV